MKARIKTKGPRLISRSESPYGGPLGLSKILKKKAMVSRELILARSEPIRPPTRLIVLMAKHQSKSTTSPLVMTDSLIAGSKSLRRPVERMVLRLRKNCVAWILMEGQSTI
ncbi:unnamed protein product [Caenorhabditis nigoni]